MLAEAPIHQLPWYFGAAVFAPWPAAAFGFLVIVRRRLRARAERRRDDLRSRRRPSSSSGSEPIPDDRSLGTGTDIEPLH